MFDLFILRLTAAGRDGNLDASLSKLHQALAPYYLAEQLSWEQIQLPSSPSTTVTYSADNTIATVFRGCHFHLYMI